MDGIYHEQEAVTVNLNIQASMGWLLCRENQMMIQRLKHKAASLNKRGWKMNYLIVVEETETGFSAYSPDVDGCIATGHTKQEVEKNMQEALEFHLAGLRLEHQEIPRSHAYSDYVEVAAPA